MNFNADTTAEEAIAGHDLTGKRAVVTGCSGGIGIETARQLVSAGAKLVMANRAGEKSQQALEQLKQEFPDADITQMSLDLGSLDSVRSFTDEYNVKFDELHLLINNAGVMACPQGTTTDGFEMQFGTNHLGHFVLTCRLVPLLKASAPARIVTVSSAAHRRASVDISDPNFENRPYDKWLSYGQSKTANILFSLELNKRLEDTGVKAYSVHPGAIITDLGRHLTEEDIEEIRNRIPDGEDGPKLVWKSVEVGAGTSIWAATATELEDKSGSYLEDCSIARANEGEEDIMGYAPYAYNGELAQKLWEISEGFVSESFNF